MMSFYTPPDPTTKKRRTLQIVSAAIPLLLLLLLETTGDAKRPRRSFSSLQHKSNFPPPPPLLLFAPNAGPGLNSGESRFPSKCEAVQKILSFKNISKEQTGPFFSPPSPSFPRKRGVEIINHLEEVLPTRNIWAALAIPRDILNSFSPF